jgi:cohesin loading factor subunit SCC2
MLGCPQADAADAEPLVFSALESIHAALAIMTHHDMPKQLYREELIERILDFSRHQIIDCMAASNPTFRALYKPAEKVTNDGSPELLFSMFLHCWSFTLL